MKMKMFKIDNMEKLMEQVNKCRGDVYVIDDNGDRLNLKSKLAQFVALTKMFHSDRIESFSLETTRQDDSFRLMEFMFEGNR